MAATLTLKAVFAIVSDLAELDTKDGQAEAFEIASKTPAKAVSVAAKIQKRLAELGDAQEAGRALQFVSDEMKGGKLEKPLLANRGPRKPKDGQEADAALAAN